jgi:hypothetical protein
MMKYAVKMGSGAMIYVPSFIKIGSAIEEFIGEDTQIHRQRGDRISLLIFYSYYRMLRKVTQDLGLRRCDLRNLKEKY